eukprot:269161_1
MGNSARKQKVTKPQTSTIISIQQKEYRSIHDCEEMRQLRQLPKTVPLRPSTIYPFQTPNPAAHLGTTSLRKSSLSDNTMNQLQVQQDNENDSSHSKTPHQLITPSIIGSNYSNTSSMRSKSSASDSICKPFNPSALPPPKLAADGMDALYKHLRQHFTSLAVKVDCNQVSCTFKIQDLDEQLAIARANMIDIDYTSNQLQRTISSMKTLSDTIAILNKQCHEAVERVNTLWKSLPNTPRSLAMFSCDAKQRRVVMEGSMVRLGSYLKGNKTRWVVLYCDGLMSYYNYERTELKGVVDLMDATEVIPSDLSHLMITIKKEKTHKTTSWHFKCPSPQHVTQWLDAIRSLHFIRAKSKIQYSETIPSQFLRDNTITIMKDRELCVFQMTHLDIDKHLYEVCVYSDGQCMYCMYKDCIKHTFETVSSYKSLGCVTLDDDIIAIQIISEQYIFFATTHCIRSIALGVIREAIQNDTNICMDRVDIMIPNEVNADHVQRIKMISDIESVMHNGFELIFICDSMEQCLWCFDLQHKTFIKLIHSPSPNGVTLQDDILYITSLQCGVYYIALKDIDFPKAFASSSFFSPYRTKTLQIFENIVLREIMSMHVPPSDLRPPESPAISHISTKSSSSSNLNCDVASASVLFVLDMDDQLYMIRLTDLVLISFGIIHKAHKLFYYPNFDHLYITKPAENRIDCICNVYHEIVSVRSSATNSSSTHSSHDDKLPPFQLNKQILNTAKTTNNTHKKKQLSDADVRALNKQNGTYDETKKLCFPKSLYLVYATMDDDEEEKKEMQSMEDVDMQILVEVDTMLQSYMLSELRQHSKRLLSYTRRNYSFLYLYTSPYDGQSTYRELDANYESSVPVKNLIQHSSIGPVILVKLKAPTKQQIRKQKKRKKRSKNKHKTY